MKVETKIILLPVFVLVIFFIGFGLQRFLDVRHAERMQLAIYTRNTVWVYNSDWKLVYIAFSQTLRDWRRRPVAKLSIVKEFRLIPH